MTYFPKFKRKQKTLKYDLDGSIFDFTNISETFVEIKLMSPYEVH